MESASQSAAFHKGPFILQLHHHAYRRDIEKVSQTEGLDLIVNDGEIHETERSFKFILGERLFEYSKVFVLAILGPERQELWPNTSLTHSAS